METPLLPTSTSEESEKITFVKLFGMKVPMNLALAFWTVLSILTAISMQIFMPLLLFTFGGAAGVYPVVFICSILFNLIFWPVCIYRHFKEKIENKKLGITTKRGFITRDFTSKLIWIGFFDASNGILSVFSSSPMRVPPVLQPIILQSYMIFTLVFSKMVLGRTYKRRQILSVLVLFLGIIVSLIPVFIELAQGEDVQFQSGAYWGVILFMASAPAAMMNIKEEQVFEENPKYDVALLIAWESLFQFLFVGFSFWTDLIPGFGTSSSFKELSTNFKGGMSCLFYLDNPDGAHCQYTMLFLVLFSLGYCLTFYFSAFLTKYASANYNSAVSSVVSPGGTIWWCIFTGVGKWIGAPPTNATDMIYALLSFVFIIPASWYFKKDDVIEKQKKMEIEEIQDEIQAVQKQSIKIN